MNSSLGELFEHRVASQIMWRTDPSLMRMLESLPVSRLGSFPGLGIAPDQLAQLLAAANANPQA